MPDMPWRALRTAARIVERRKLDVEIEALEHLPKRGPAIVAARHVHHLYDGCVLISAIPRPAHILVAGDWVSGGIGRFVFDRACASARWPVVQRPGGPNAIDPRVAASSFRQATRDALDLFREGRILIVFPEGYPNIDPTYTPKLDADSWLPFMRGFTRLAVIAQREGLDVPIIPAGLTYRFGERSTVSLRFGEPVRIMLGDTETIVGDRIASDVRRLSEVPL